jgi:hypothetical protein
MAQTEGNPQAGTGKIVALVLWKSGGTGAGSPSSRDGAACASQGVSQAREAVCLSAPLDADGMDGAR